MFFDFSQYSFYVAPGGTDMRKGADGFARFVRDSILLDPFSKNMFLFCSKNRKTLAVLVWDNGFWLMKKKIYSGTFAWPSNGQEALKITVDDVKRIIQGEDVFRKIDILPQSLQF